MLVLQSSESVLSSPVHRSPYRMSWSEQSLDHVERKFNRYVKSPMRTSSSTIKRYRAAMAAAVIESSRSKEHPNRSAVLKRSFSKQFVNQVSGDLNLLVMISLVCFLSCRAFDDLLIYIHMCTKILTCIASICPFSFGLFVYFVSRLLLVFIHSCIQ